MSNDAYLSRNESIRALRLKYSDAIKILHAVDIDADTRVIVFGDPEMGSYEWGIEVKGKVEQHSNAGYGNLPGALRDGLMTAWPPMDDGLTPGCAKPSETAYTDWTTERLQQAAADIQRVLFSRRPAPPPAPEAQYECCGVWRPCRMPNCVPGRVDTHRQETHSKEAP